ncbi:MAG: hypothetical protein ACRD1Z_09710, partial [Vicinamibacteria bacterium]
MKASHGIARVLVALLLASGAAACRKEPSSRGAAAEENHEHAGGAAMTVWTESLELFFEHPPMVAGGRGEPWAIHLTFLEDFQPVRDGRLTLRFVGPDGAEHTTVAEAPARAGIFTPAPSLPERGTYHLAMTLESA